jgi:hypothetical protein
MQRHPAATRDDSVTDAATVDLETNFLLSVFAELTGRSRLSDGSAVEPVGTAAVSSDRTPPGR